MILPIVYTAVKLEFVSLDSVEITILEKGKEFIKLGIKERDIKRIYKKR